jgi:hypothetical protein
MEYRKFGETDVMVSALGFGCMRLPTLGEYAEIDEDQATDMVRYAIDHGVNYVDTAYGYHGGNSERFVGRALKDGYREKVNLATKLPSWLVKEPADFDRLLNEQLEKLDVEHIDFYLLHSLNKKFWDTIYGFDVLEWAEGALADGRIGHLGFSFHDDYAVFKEIVDAYDNWTFCQIQYNLIDLYNQAGRAGLRYAASKGLAVVIMEPLLGGRLVDPPEAIQTLWDSTEADRSPVDWALQWLWDQPEVSVVLSGMSEMGHVEENLASASRSGVGHLTPEERELAQQVRETYQTLCPVPCTACKYCMPCPNGVDIPKSFRIYNNGVMYNQLDKAREGYAKMAEEERASACIQCRQCEELCPQHIVISERMVEVEAVLGQGQPYTCV